MPRRQRSRTLTQAHQRALALGAARSQLRRLGMVAEHASFQDVLAVLDDLSRAEPTLIAVQWYREASEAQLGLLRREWRRQHQACYTQLGLWTHQDTAQREREESEASHAAL